MQGKSTQDVVDALRELEEPVDWYRDYETVYRRGYAYMKGAEQVTFDLPEFAELRDFIEFHVYI